MTGDFTRDTFRPAKGYSAVRMQQGRLLTDADWNEQGDIQRHALRTTTRSVIGASGFPEDNPGFAILPAKSPGVVIGGGEAYVDGTRIDYPGPAELRLKRVSGAGAATRWQLEAGPRVRVGDQLVLQGNMLDQSVPVSTLHPDVSGRQQFQCAAPLSASNDITVARHHSPESQPFHPGVPLPPAGDYLFYLDVWERPIGPDADPLIREAAFGGPDTAWRDQTVWQVKRASFAELVAAGALTLPASCKSFGPGWTPFGNAPRGRMGARAEAAEAAVDPCALPVSGGYRSLENHLYRVEVHNGGMIAGGAVTVKWSRDNAIHATRYSEKDNVALIVDSIGRDAQSALTKDDWIEILDDARSLAGKPGFFARISDVNGNRVSLGEVLHPDTLDPITSNGAPDLTGLPSAGLARRWEGGAPVEVAADSWVPLENGVQAIFAAGRYATGDHWLIPARSISASIEWPAEEATGNPALLPPAGIVHHYCALALGTLANGNWALTDCRTLFPPLTALRSFLYLGGDGQEAMPDPLNPATRIALDAELRVGVVRGRTPVAGATVEFAITTGDGRLGPIADNLKTRKVQTGADGVARVSWSVDAATQAQQLTARLLDSAGTPTHAPIVFTATLSRAAEVSFDPANTPALAGENTVQGAIEKLAGMQQIGCSTYVIVEGSDWVSVLEGMKAGEDAAICFQRGTYETDRTVVLKNLGHLTVSGAGNGTRIVAKRNECALRFETCASVTLHDLDVSAPDGSGAIDPISGRLGTVTIVDCPEVDVTDLDLSCGAGVTAERSCLTIAGVYEPPKAEGDKPVDRPLRSVRVLRNRLWVGLGQDGVLVAHATNTLIADNEIEVVVTKGGGLRPERRFEEKRMRRKLIALLVADPKPAKGRGNGGQKVIQVGEFEVTFESLVPQSEWDAFVAAHPPQANEKGSQRGVAKYLERLIEILLENPKALPSFDGALGTLGARMGSPRMATLEPEVKRTLAIATDPKVGRPEPPQVGEGRVLVQAGGASIEFGSPVNQADWNSALSLAPAKGVLNATGLRRHVEKVAGRIIADARFRERLGSARKWYEKLTSDLPTQGRQAIVCGGKTLDEVSVRGNRVWGFVEGVHIGTSYKAKADAPLSMSRMVSVCDNNLFLRKQTSEVYAPMGLFVGNVQTVRIERNLLDWAGTPMSPGYSNGIRVWGHIGRFLMISENRITTGHIGIRVKPISNLPDQYWNSQLWVAADNLVENVPPDRVVRGPPFLRSRDNRPI